MFQFKDTKTYLNLVINKALSILTLRTSPIYTNVGVSYSGHYSDIILLMDAKDTVLCRENICT